MITYNYSNIMISVLSSYLFVKVETRLVTTTSTVQPFYQIVLIIIISADVMVIHKFTLVSDLAALNQ